MSSVRTEYSVGKGPGTLNFRFKQLNTEVQRHVAAMIYSKSFRFLSSHLGVPDTL